MEVGSWALADGEGRALEIQSTEVKREGLLFSLGVSSLFLCSGS